MLASFYSKQFSCHSKYSQYNTAHTHTQAIYYFPGHRPERRKKKKMCFGVRCTIFNYREHLYRCYIATNSRFQYCNICIYLNMRTSLFLCCVCVCYKWFTAYKSPKRRRKLLPLAKYHTHSQRSHHSYHSSSEPTCLFIQRQKTFHIMLLLFLFCVFFLVSV